MNRPNFFIVGASKAGTTSLAQALASHPSIFMTKPKEPNFFNRFDESPEIPQGKFENYLKLFNEVGDAEILGEASVSYLSSPRAPYHIAQMNAHSKILISLRNPLQRILSLYEMYVRHGQKQSFQYCTRTDPWLVRQCLYYESIKRYLDAFPRENIYLVEFSDVVTDWSGSIEALHGFLEVDKIRPAKPTTMNIGGVPRNLILKNLLNRKTIDFGKKLIPDRHREWVDRRIKRVFYKKSEIYKENLDLLIGSFIEDTEKLDSVLGSNYCELWFSDTKQSMLR